MSQSKNPSAEGPNRSDEPRLEPPRAAAKKRRRLKRLGPIQLKRVVETARLDDAELKTEGVHADLMHLIYREMHRPSASVRGAFVPNPVLVTMLPERVAFRLGLHLRTMNRVLAERFLGRVNAGPSRRDRIFAESHEQWLKNLPEEIGRTIASITEQLAAEVDRIVSATESASRTFLPRPRYPEEYFQILSRN